MADESANSQSATSGAEISSSTRVKWCPGCSARRPWAEFSDSPDEASGKRSYCMACERKLSAERRERYKAQNSPRAEVAAATLREKLAKIRGRETGSNAVAGHGPAGAPGRSGGASPEKRSATEPAPWPQPMDDEPTEPSGAAPAPFRLLHIDIETSPILGYVWQTKNQDLSPAQILEPSSVLCFAAMWHGSDEVLFHRAIPGDAAEFREMMRAAHRLLSTCDAVCSYNGQKFDAPRLMREFLLLDMRPPPPLVHVDLWRTITKFNFDSSKLEHVGPALGVGEKIKNAGWPLWTGCMRGDPQRWAEMEEYCKGDVVQLPALYRRLLPWIDQHPNLNLLATQDDELCPSCGAADLERSGVHRAVTLAYPRFVCRACGRWCRSRVRSRAEPRAEVR